MEDLAQFPLSFKYDGKTYRGFGSDFTEISRKQEERERGGAAVIVTLKHTLSGADFRLETCVYEAYGACEWTLYITNNGTETTKRFSEIHAVDMEFEGRDPVIKGIHGDVGKDMYAPYAVVLKEGTVFSKESVSGRPTHGVFPYFNVEYGDGGAFIALGWPGCWRAEASAEGERTHFTGGQLEINTVLNPGETIRTPLVAVVHYSGRNEMNAMNQWRRWFIDCSMVQPDGQPLQPAFAAWSMCQGASAKTMKRIIQGYAAHDVPLDYFWMDAGWYTDPRGNTVEWPQTGTLLVDESRFPDHFASITEEISKTGGKTLLWFEPEVVRIDKETFLKDTPDFEEAWMLGTAMSGTWLEGQLLNLGDEGCRNWLLARISQVIEEGGISVYRQDFNVDPAPVWRACETEDRLGYVENQYVMGYLALWDTLLARFPGLWIDSCASGGGRNDLETMRRAVPLHISDYWDGNPGGYDERQATLLSVRQWLPYIKMWRTDNDMNSLVYTSRSCYASWFMVSINVMSQETPWDTVKMLKKEWEEVSQYFYKDYYPLTPWDNSDSAWRGWEYFDAEQNKGIAQLFRPSASKAETQTIRFYGLRADGQYRISDTDGLFSADLSGKALMEEGLSITLPNPSYAMVIRIQGL